MTIETLTLLLLVLLFPLLLYLLRRVNRGINLLEEWRQEHDEGGELFNQMESYLFLRDRLNLRQGLPYTRDWSAAPDFLKLIVEHALATKPLMVMECSSGLTTLMLGRCCQLNGKGRVYSLENGEPYAEKTREHIERYGLSEYVSVIHAPLQKGAVKGSEYQWYALDDLPQGSIDMLVVDGPPGFIQKHSRYPALPLLFDKLSDNCVIFLDDAARPEERELVEMWLAEYPQLRHEYIKTERGCSVLTLNNGERELLN
ncbi:MAG: class I SAM-dependent methyltransferase [Candidatus Sedimenticola sp. (ex Thyasira tokunagai)]